MAAAPSASRREQELGRWPCRCKKTNGELVLTASRLLLPSPQGPLPLELTAELTWKFNRRKGSPGEKSLVRFECLDGSGAALTAEFTHNEAKWQHQGELEAWILAFTEERRRAGHEHRREAERLEPQLRTVFGNLELKERYAVLVDKVRALTPNEFIRAYRPDIAASASLPCAGDVDITSLRVGAGDKGRNTKQSAGDGGLSEEEVHATFRDFPAIRSLYYAQVPSMLKAEQFWERYLRSRYFLEATGKEVPLNYRTDSLFDSLEKKEVELPLPTKVAALADVDADLTCEPSGDKLDSKRKSTRLIDRLNERSAVAVTALVEAAATAAAVAKPVVAVREGTGKPMADMADALERRRTALRRSLDPLREDLRSDAPPAKTPRLHLEPGFPTPAQRLPHAATGTALRTTKHGAELRERLRQANQKWAGPRQTPGAAVRPPAEAAARWVLKEAINDLVQAHRVGESVAGNAADGPGPPSDVASVMSRVRSLLRHFWLSKRGDAALRSRLARALDEEADQLKEWEAARQAPPGSAREARVAAARSLLPSVTRALEVAGSRELLLVQPCNGTRV